MTKETQTQAIAEPFKFKNAALLNRLSEMAQVPYYATACHTLIQAEMAIVELERENATLRAEVERLAARSAPLQQAEPPRPHTTANIEALCKTRAAAQVEPVRMLTKEALTDLIAQHLSGTYHCLRVWEAWHVGTMSADDFQDVGESDTPAELADAIIAAGKRIPADGEVRG